LSVHPSSNVSDPSLLIALTHRSAGYPHCVSRARSTEIAGLAFLSDCQTSALVDGHGSITWMCPPRFDSRSVFGALRDPAAGHWQLGAAGLNDDPGVRRGGLC